MKTTAYNPHIELDSPIKKETVLALRIDGVSYTLMQLPVSELNELWKDARSRGLAAVPRYYVPFPISNNKVILWPTPDKEYEVVVS